MSSWSHQPRRRRLALIQAVLPSSIDLVAGPVGDATVRVDPGQFDQVLLNVGAQRAGCDGCGGTLTIGVTITGTGDLRPAVGTLEPGKVFAVFQVTDTGTGI